MEGLNIFKPIPVVPLSPITTETRKDLESHHVVVVDDHQLDVFGFGLD